MRSKTDLRREIAARKSKCSPERRAALSANVLHHLEENARFRAARCVLLYHSLPDEVQTHAFLEKWGAHKQIVLPVVVGDDLELRLFRGGSYLATGAFGIQEPTGEPFTQYESIDVAVIPGIAFDVQGHRLGRGRGYYDRLLPHLQTSYKIGLCFPFQLLSEIPSEAHDVPMDEVVC